jgi:hypothetical protein
MRAGRAFPERLALAVALVASAGPLAAQARIPIDVGPVGQSAVSRGDTAIDLTTPPPAREEPTPAEAQECDEAQDASALSGEIVVCRKLPVDNSDRLAGSREAWLKDYAERTKDYNTIAAPDVDNTRHPFTGSGATIVFTGCFIPPCPPPHAILVDVEGLPPPPHESDADRIARGLPPRGEDRAPSEHARKQLEAELALPPRPDLAEAGRE